MSLDLSESPAVLESACGALDEVRGAHDEFESFFGDVFEQLQSLWLELYGRHKCLDAQACRETAEEGAAAQHEQQFRQCVEALRQVLGEIRGLQKVVQRDRNDVSQWQETVQNQLEQLLAWQREQTELVGELKRMRSLMEALSGPKASESPGRIARKPAAPRGAAGTARRESGPRCQPRTPTPEPPCNTTKIS